MPQTAKQAEVENVKTMSEAERQAMRDADFAGKPGAVPQVDESKFDRTTQVPTRTSDGPFQTADEIEAQNQRIMQNRAGITGTIDGVGGRAPAQAHETLPGTQTTGNRPVFENPNSNAARVTNPDPNANLTGQPLRTPDVQSGQTDGGDAKVPGGEVKDFESMTIAELREYAEEHEIDLTGLTLKADIIEAIEKA